MHAPRPEPFTSAVVALGFDRSRDALSAPGVEGPLLGAGSLSCDTGFLTFGPAPSARGDCTFTATRATSLLLLGGDVIRTVTLETREGPSAACGPMPDRCMVQYRLDLRK